MMIDLDPAIKKVCTRIYDSDRTKYRRLIQWVKTMQKREFADEMISDTLLAFEAFQNSTNDWWPYLNGVIAKIYTKAKQGESQQYKSMSKAELTKVGDVLRKIMGL